MSTLFWLAVLGLLALALIALRRDPGLADRTDQGIHNLALIGGGLIVALILLYAAVKFVRWAWEN